MCWQIIHYFYQHYSIKNFSFRSKFFWVRRTRWSFYLGALAPKAPKKSAPMSGMAKARALKLSIKGDYIKSKG